MASAEFHGEAKCLSASMLPLPRHLCRITTSTSTAQNRISRNCSSNFLFRFMNFSELCRRGQDLPCGGAPVLPSRRLLVCRGRIESDLWAIAFRQGATAWKAADRLPTTETCYAPTRALSDPKSVRPSVVLHVPWLGLFRSDATIRVTKSAGSGGSLVT